MQPSANKHREEKELAVSTREANMTWMNFSVAEEDNRIANLQ